MLGTQLRHNVHSLNGTGLGLALGLAGTLYGARGVASAAQNVFNHSWQVPKTDRPGFPLNTLRSLGLIVAVGGGVVITTALSGLGAGSGAGAAIRVGALFVSFLLNIGLFWLAFRLGTAKCVAGRDFIIASIVAAVSWQALQAAGTFLVAHELKNASEVYGTFAFVIGLLWWIFMQAQFTLYAFGNRRRQGAQAVATQPRAAPSDEGGRAGLIRSTPKRRSGAGPKTLRSARTSLSKQRRRKEPLAQNASRACDGTGRGRRYRGTWRVRGRERGGPSYCSSSSSGTVQRVWWGPQLASTQGLIPDHRQALVHGGSHSRCGDHQHSHQGNRADG